MFNSAPYFAGFVENILSIIENNFTSICNKIKHIYELLNQALSHLSCCDIKWFPFTTALQYKSKYMVSTLCNSDCMNREEVELPSVSETASYCLHHSFFFHKFPTHVCFRTWDRVSEQRLQTQEHLTYPQEKNLTLKNLQGS